MVMLRLRKEMGPNSWLKDEPNFPFMAYLKIFL